MLAGIYVERLCFRAVRRDAALASMVSSFVIWMQLEEVAVHLLPERTYAFPSLFVTGSFELGPFLFRAEQITMLALAAVMVGALHLLLHRTRYGLALRALSESPRAAAYMGIDTAWVMLCAFALVSLVGGVAGYAILATDEQITPYFGLWATFKGLIAMMLGGMGSLPGAILGGLVLGVVEGPCPVVPGQRVQGPERLRAAVSRCWCCAPGGFLGPAHSRPRRARLPAGVSDGRLRSSRCCRTSG